MAYVDVDKLINKINSRICSILIRGAVASIINETINDSPTADVEEVKHGEWKLMGTEKFMDGSYSSKFFCSKCLREIGVCHEHESDNHKYAKSMYPYCHCGAKMDVSKMEITTSGGKDINVPTKDGERK